MAPKRKAAAKDDEPKKEEEDAAPKKKTKAAEEEDAAPKKKTKAAEEEDAAPKKKKKAAPKDEKEKVVPQAGKEVPNFPGLPQGWRAVEKVYSTGSYSGQTYMRFYGPGHSSVCSIKKAISLHAEDTGQNVDEVMAEYEAVKLAQKKKNDEERQAKGLLDGQAKKDAISAFKAKYGDLFGALVCLLPGWRGESKLLANCGQVSARYYSPDGTQYSLINQIEAFFGFKLLNGQADEIPDIELARSKVVYDESGKIVHAARKADAVKEEFEFAEVKTENKRAKKKDFVMYAEPEHYRATEYVNVVRLHTDSAESDLTAHLVPDVEQVVADSVEIRRRLGERGSKWVPDMLYVTGARSQRSPGVRVMNQFSGFFFYRCQYNDRPCFQRVLKVGDKLACSGHHLMWSNLRKQWKIGQILEDKAGLAICNQDVPEPFGVSESWCIFEPKLQDVEKAVEEYTAEAKAAKAARIAELRAAEAAETSAPAKAAGEATDGGGKDGAS